MNICEYEGETRGYDTYFNGCVNIPFSGTSLPFRDMERPQRGEGSLPTKGPVEQAEPVFRSCGPVEKACALARDRPGSDPCLALYRLDDYTGSSVSAPQDPVCRTRLLATISYKDERIFI